MSRLRTVLLVALLASPAALPGQARTSAPGVVPGARVRITQLGEKPRIAVVVAGNTDTLLVRWTELTDTVAVPLAAIARLDVSTGRHRNVLRSAMVGTLAVGTAGAVLGAATYQPCNSTEAFGCFLEPTSRGESAAMGGVVGGVLGLVVGTLVGLPRREGWHQVSLDARRVAVAITPRGRGTALGLSLQF